jgi:hypothetical protein
MVAWRAAMEGVAASHWDEAGAEQPRWRRRIAEEIESSGNASYTVTMNIRSKSDEAEKTGDMA